MEMRISLRLGLVLSSVALATLAVSGCGGSGAGTPQAGTASPVVDPSVVVTPATAQPTTPSSGGVAGTPVPSRSSARSAPVTGRPVTVIRAGGLAGTTVTVTVDERGRWEFEGRAADSAARSGTLASAERSRLWQLLADPALAAEAKGTLKPPNCADGFSYTVSTGSTKVFWHSCGGAAPEVAGDVVRLLADATPL